MGEGTSPWPLAQVIGRTPEWTQRFRPDKDQELPGKGSPESAEVWLLRAGSQGGCSYAEVSQILAEQGEGFPFFPEVPKESKHPYMPGFDFSFINVHLGNSSFAYVELEKDFSDSPYLKH